MKKKMGKRKIIIASMVVFIIAITGGYLITKHFKSDNKAIYTFSQSTAQNMVAYPDSSFAVMSDLHYYDKSLGTTGAAFEACLKSDRKLLRDSGDLLNLAVNNILKSKVKFVLVSGDLTKDGELICHQKVAKALSAFTQRGIQVFVVPGNHDVNNPGAYRYEGDKVTSVPNITPKQFEEIYKNCGYSSAIYRDVNSLSYVAEPVKNMWLVALDTCRYRDNKAGKEETVSGKLNDNEEKWLEGILKKANDNKKAVIVLEHHGIVEHWTGQSKLHPEYLVQNYKEIGKLMASYDVRLAFTGHYHAQDITKGDFQSKGYLYDVETGSLITAPCPVRFCDIANNKITIRTTDLVDRLHPGTAYAAKANKFVLDTVSGEAYKTLRKYFVSPKDARYIADYVATAFAAHYRGDENPKDRPVLSTNKLGLWSRFIYSKEKYVVDGLWKDLPPADNNVTLNLSKNESLND